MRASIDIGSNSTLLLLAQVKEGVLQIYEDYAEVTALGKGIDKSKLFASESMDKTYLVLKKYKEICEKNDIQPNTVIVTATEASRVVKNAAEFFAKIKNELAFEVKLISAEGEAYYTALGASLGDTSGSEQLALCDIGGASTELILFNQSKKTLDDFISLPLGSVRVKDWQESGKLELELKKIHEQFTNSKLKVFQNKKIFWTAGTMTALSAVIQKLPNFNADKVHQSCFKRAILEKTARELTEVSIEQIGLDFPYLGKRAHTLASGAYVALQLSKWLGIEDFIVSNFGLRHGTLYQGKIDESYLLDRCSDN